VKKKSKTKTTTNQQTHMTSTPNNPEWSTNLISGIAGQVGDLSRADPYSFVAGPDALQTQAGAGAAGLTTSPYFGEAADMFGQAGNAGAQDIAGNISAFYNPFEQRVVDTSLADFDYGAGQQNAQANLDLAGDTTFGGSSGALYKSALGGELARGRGALSAGIRSDGFKTALGGATSQAQLNEQALQRKLQGAAGIAGVGQAQGDQERANIGAQASMGDMLQQLAQRRATAPLSLLGTQASLAGGLPLGMFTGQTQDGTMNSNSTSKTTVSDPMGSIGGMLGAAGSLASGLGSLGLGFGAASTLAKGVGMPSAASIAGNW
jgi:hypothetical protein